MSSPRHTLNIDTSNECEDLDDFSYPDTYKPITFSPDYQNYLEDNN